MRSEKLLTQCGSLQLRPITIDLSGRFALWVCAIYLAWEHIMCRNIKTLFNFDPPVNEEEIHAASLQFVRKISGFNKPSKTNEAAFMAAIEEVSAAAARLLHSLETSAPRRNREVEAAKAKERAAIRFGD